MTEIAQDIACLANGIALHLEKTLKENSGFKLRTFYAETYSLALLSFCQKLTGETELILLNEFKNKNKSDSEFHFEFNNYALAEASLMNNGKYDDLFMPLVFKGTSCTNWTLLRETLKLRLKEGNLDIIKEKIRESQKPSGLIQDDPGVHSFQYHCFSTSLIYEAYQVSKEEELKAAFLKAVNFIKNFILSNGDTLYIGRGQEQSFGYGTLIYILAAHFQITADSQSLSEIKHVLSYLKKYIRQDNSFPLMMNNLEPLPPADVDLLDEKFAGWYAYNNYYDYLAFLGYYLKKTELLLRVLALPEEVYPRTQVGYCDEDYKKFSTLKYLAVWARPGGYWTNDQTFPLVYYKSKIQTPCLGGEQFEKSLYSEEQLSFPVLYDLPKKISWRKLGKSRWFSNSLLWFSPLGLWKKSIIIKNDIFTIETSLWTPFKASDLISLDSNTKQVDDYTLISNDLKIKCNKKISFYKDGLCAKGKISVYKIDGKSNMLTVEML